MVKMCFVFIVVILSCSSLKKQYTRKEDCGLTFTLSNRTIQQNNSIEFYFKNENTYDIEISHPECSINTFVNLYDETNRNVKRLLIYKANNACRNRFIKIKGGDSLKVTYPYIISKLFDVQPGKKYLLKSDYAGIFKLNGKKFNCSGIVLSDTILVVN